MEKKILLFIGIGCLTVLALHAAIVPTQPETPMQLVPEQATEQKPDEQPPVVTPAPITYPLHSACEAEDMEQLRDAIKAFTDDGTLTTRINQLNKDGETALHLAAQTNQNTLALVQALIDAGADKKIINRDDALPIDFIIADDPQNDPTSQLLAVSDEERQELVMQARQKEIEANNTINEADMVSNKVEVITEAQPIL